jgi:hypothetical protein
MKRGAKWNRGTNLNTKRTNNTSNKWANELNSKISKEVQMVNNIQRNIQHS